MQKVKSMGSSFLQLKKDLLNEIGLEKFLSKIYNRSVVFETHNYLNAKKNVITNKQALVHNKEKKPNNLSLFSIIFMDFTVFFLIYY